MKYNKLYRWFLTLMMSLPIISIAVRCIYVQKNENANQSYSGQNEIQYVDITSTSQLDIGKRYYFNSQLGTYSSNSTANTGLIFYTDIQNYNFVNTQLKDALDTGDSFRFYYSTTAVAIYVFNDSTSIYSIAVNDTNTLSFDFVLQNYSGNDLSRNMTFLKSMENVNYYNLDNAFEYSVNEFNNVGFNKVNFTRWFTDLFTNGDNIYTTFINSYCNYVLFSTCVLALPYFLYWFITFVMGLMDRFGRKEIMR